MRFYTNQTTFKDGSQLEIFQCYKNSYAYVGTETVLAGNAFQLLKLLENKTDSAELKIRMIQHYRLTFECSGSFRIHWTLQCE